MTLDQIRPRPQIDPDDEILTAKVVAKISGNRSVRWAQKQFEIGEPKGIRAFHMGREEVTLRSLWTAWVFRLIDKEAERQKELEG